MKKTGLIIIISFTVLLAGCTVEKNELMKNGKGASAAAYWLDATEDCLMLFPDMAFKFNAWLNAPADKQDSIKNLYFPHYDIQRSGDRWYFYLDNRRIFGINTLGTHTLNNTSDVSWVVGWDSNAMASNSFHRTYVYESTAMISRINNSNTWVIDAMPFWMHPGFPTLSKLELTLPDNSVPATLVGQDFSLSGDGHYHFYAFKNQDKDVYYCQSFTIEDAKIHDFKGMDNRNLWTSGNLSLTIFADWDTVPENYVEEENLKARLFAKEDKQHAFIFMHDIEEDWVLPDPQYMDDHGQESSFIDWLFPWF